MWTAQFRWTPWLCVTASIGLHAIFVVALIAGRIGPPRTASPVAATYAVVDGTTALPVDLRSFAGPPSPGRPAPQVSNAMTAGAPAGAVKSQRGVSDRTILPVEQPPTLFLGM